MFPDGFCQLPASGCQPRWHINLNEVLNDAVRCWPHQPAEINRADRKISPEKIKGVLDAYPAVSGARVLDAGGRLVS